MATTAASLYSCSEFGEIGDICELGEIGDISEVYLYNGSPSLFLYLLFLFPLSRHSLLSLLLLV